MRFSTSAANLSTPRVLITALAVVLASLLLAAPAARGDDVRLSVSVGIPLYYSGYDNQGYLQFSTGYWGGGHGRFYGKPHYRYRTHYRHDLWPHNPYGKRHLHYGKPHHFPGKGHGYYGNHRGHGKDHHFFGSHRGHGGKHFKHFDRYHRPHFRGHRR